MAMAARYGSIVATSANPAPNASVIMPVGVAAARSIRCCQRGRRIRPDPRGPPFFRTAFGSIQKLRVIKPTPRPSWIQPTAGRSSRAPRAGRTVSAPAISSSPTSR